MNYGYNSFVSFCERGQNIGKREEKGIKRERGGKLKNQGEGGYSSLWEASF